MKFVQKGRTAALRPTLSHSSVRLHAGGLMYVIRAVQLVPKAGEEPAQLVGQIRPAMRWATGDPGSAAGFGSHVIVFAMIFKETWLFLLWLVGLDLRRFTSMSIQLM